VTGQAGASLIPWVAMSKEFRPWKIDEAQLLPPSVQDYVPKEHVSRLIVSLVREALDLSTILGSYRSGLGQPPSQSAPKPLQVTTATLQSSRKASHF